MNSYRPALSGPIRTRAFDLPAMTFSTLRAGLSNSSGVESSLATYSDTRLPAGTRISSGSNLWFRMTRLNSCARAVTVGAPSTARAGANKAAMNTIPRISFVTIGYGPYEGLQKDGCNSIVEIIE